MQTFQKMATINALLALAFWASGLVATSCAATIQTFKLDAKETAANGINSKGTVVGSSSEGVAFIRTSDGTITTFAVSGSLFTTPLSVNDKGQIAGYFGTGSKTDWVEHGFLRNVDGSFVQIDISGAQLTGAGRVNKYDTVLGSYISNGLSHGFFRLSDGTITTFDPPQSTNTYPSDINDNGTIVGDYWDENGADHGFVLAPDGTSTSFDIEGAESVYPAAINNNGIIAGSYLDGNFVFHGFVRATDGTVTTIDVPGGIGTSINGMNAKGAVAGTYFDSSNLAHGFLETAKEHLITFNAAKKYDRTEVICINNSGVVAGFVGPNDEPRWKGFIRIP